MGCRYSHTYSAFLGFIREYPDIQIVQMDSHIGSRGGRLLLNILFLENIARTGFFMRCKNFTVGGRYFCNPAKDWSEFSNLKQLKKDRTDFPKLGFITVFPVAHIRRGQLKLIMTD